jgi:hypothetical protein
MLATPTLPSTLNACVRYADALALRTGQAHGVELGRTYVRIHQGSARGARSIVRFVRVTDGAVFAPKSWKAPNLSRRVGSIGDLSRKLMANVVLGEAA